MPKANWMNTSQKFIYRTVTGTVITPYKSGYCPSLERRYAIRKYDKPYPVPYCGFYLSKDHCFVCPPDLSPEVLQSQYLPDYKIVNIKPTVAMNMQPFHAGVDHLKLPQEVYLREAKEAVSIGYHRIFCNMQTGFGKTIAAILMMHHHSLKTCVITYMDRLFRQWGDTISSITDISPGQVYQIRGSKSIEKILADPFRFSQYDVFMVSHETLTSYGAKYGYSSISELFAVLGIGVKIYDEAHHSIKSMISIDSFTSVAYTYYLTADYNQSNDEKAKKYRMIFRNVPILPTSGKGARYVTCLSMIYDSVPGMHDLAAVHTSNGFNLLNYMKYQFRKNYIYDCIDEVLDKLEDSRKFNSDGRILILTSYIEHVEALYKHICIRYADSLGKIGMYHGSMDPEDKEITKETCRVIIATYSSFGVGVDAPNIQCVISCDPTSRITANQAAGRVRPSDDPQKYALFVMIYDDGFGYCQATRKKIIDYIKQGKGLKFINVWRSA